MTSESSATAETTSNGAAPAAPAQADGKAIRAAKKSARQADTHGPLGDRPVAGPAMTPMHPRGGQEIAASKPAARGADGKFEPKPRILTQGDMRGVTESVFQTALRTVRGEPDPTETGREALDNVKPASKSPAQKPSDPDAETSAATEEAPDKPDERATRSKVKDLENARKALKLEGWADAELDELSEEAILRNGRRAKDRQVEEAHRLRREADAHAKDPGSTKPAATEATKRDAAKSAETDDEDAWHTSTAKEAFRDFDGGDGTEPFVGAISKFTRAAVERGVAAHAKAIEKAVTAALSQTIGEMRLDAAIDRLRADFPEVDTDDGRPALLERVTATASAKAKKGEKANAYDLVRAECMALWGEKRVESAAAKAAKIKAAKEAGSAVAAISDSDATKPETLMELSKRTIREKRAELGR